MRLTTVSWLGNTVPGVWPAASGTGAPASHARGGDGPGCGARQRAALMRPTPTRQPPGREGDARSPALVTATPSSLLVVRSRPLSVLVIPEAIGWWRSALRG